ncbi:MAG: YkgJ family cysteine cluster protein [Deltaproteobacteria bacterium]|nr:YkgJ family cysteine cluster protein [Deltaproteobacteria bacterium]
MCWLVIFIFTMIIYQSDRLAAHLFRIKQRSEYLRQGSCQKTGQCCQALAIEVPRSFMKREKLLHWVKRWCKSIYNFHYLGTINENWLVFECHYLSDENTCRIYPFRPKLCREFPQTTLWGKGNLHKGCGFWFLKRTDQGSFQEKLVRQQHEQERKEFRLHIKKDLSN